MVTQPIRAGDPKPLPDLMTPDESGYGPPNVIFNKDSRDDVLDIPTFLRRQMD
jgi:hypothetical protein